MFSKVNLAWHFFYAYTCMMRYTQSLINVLATSRNNIQWIDIQMYMHSYVNVSNIKAVQLAK